MRKSHSPVSQREERKEITYSGGPGPPSSPSSPEPAISSPGLSSGRTRLATGGCVGGGGWIFRRPSRFASSVKYVYGGGRVEQGVAARHCVAE